MPCARRLPAWFLGCVCLVAAAAPARAEPTTSDLLRPLETRAETPVRVDPTLFARPPRLTVFPSCADPFQIARGPVEIRDEMMLAQVRLTLPAVAPDVLQRGRWLLRLRLDSGNDFGTSMDGPPSDPRTDRHFVVDGERNTLEAQVRRGFGCGLDAGIRVPVRWRGGGVLDGLIEWWHARLGFLNNDREDFPQNQFVVEGRDDAFQEIAWTDTGWGLGNVELDARWEFLRPSRRSGWRCALIGRASLPTGTGPFETNGVDLGLQAVAAHQVGRRLDVYGGVGGTWFSENMIRGVEYETYRGHGFLALEWRAMAFLSVLVQTDVGSRLVTNLAEYPAIQWYVQVGVKADLGGGWRLTGGVTEGLVDQQSTSDVDFWLSMEVVF